MEFHQHQLILICKLVCFKFSIKHINMERFTRAFRGFVMGSEDPPEDLPEDSPEDRNNDSDEISSEETGTEKRSSFLDLHDDPNYDSDEEEKTDPIYRSRSNATDSIAAAVRCKRKRDDRWNHEIFHANHDQNNNNFTPAFSPTDLGFRSHGFGNSMIPPMVTPMIGSGPYWRRRIDYQSRYLDNARLSGLPDELRSIITEKVLEMKSQFTTESTVKYMNTTLTIKVDENNVVNVFDYDCGLEIRRLSPACFGGVYSGGDGSLPVAQFTLHQHIYDVFIYPLTNSSNTNPEQPENKETGKESGKERYNGPLTEEAANRFAADGTLGSELGSPLVTFLPRDIYVGEIGKQLNLNGGISLKLTLLRDIGSNTPVPDFFTKKLNEKYSLAYNLDTGVNRNNRNLVEEEESLNFSDSSESTEDTDDSSDEDNGPDNRDGPETREDTEDDTDNDTDDDSSEED